MGDSEPSRLESEHREALDIESSDNEEDHFSDASEGQNMSSSDASLPAPSIKVEKTDNVPSHGEVPGTAAYEARKQDAAPDEVQVIPEEIKEDASSNVSVSEKSTISGHVSAPLAPSEDSEIQPINETSHDVPPSGIGEVEATEHSVHENDDNQSLPQDPTSEGFTTPLAPAAETMDQDADSTVEPQSGISSSTNEFQGATGDGFSESSFVATPGGFPAFPEPTEGERQTSLPEHVVPPTQGENELEELVDDFDDFEEGGDDDDFGDFDNGFQQPTDTELTENTFPPSAPQTPQPSSDAPALDVVDFSKLSSPNDVLGKTEEHLNALFPIEISDLPSFEIAPDDNPIFLTERSASLWSQLAAPPPLQPPNWVRSRIRRLFLVSLGVPVDLDEILPASKQKKLVLPSIKSPRPSFDGRRESSSGKQGSQTLDSSSSDSRKRREPQPPELDLPSTKMLCTTTEAALLNLNDEELRSHVQKLEDLIGKAGKVLEYWLKRKDSAIGDKEVFEGVIENLVKHARNVRK
ncbi:hypothetical protein L228DRAFT_261324 [Xylona heveae TC161]|uniref:Uncharacterized protein n=1 Tax=Xylona heveae (strain CBS 132557 / TC161) TaxID=1328760 RepID=A0A165GEX1_XYLHT|nr:hypothetical protein L228DRAFT_261324 [Xylona heveae TC161]KZF22104.1 hypothetical protein L228DRAFT_261324 [Xylona heveae TC161]